MGIGKQAKTLTKKQCEMVFTHLGSNTRNGKRNQLIFLLSTKSGLRAKEIAHLKWEMVVGSDGGVGESIHLPNSSSKGKSGRIIPIHPQVKTLLVDIFTLSNPLPSTNVIRSERSLAVTAQVIVNMFKGWYNEMGLVGCSSHSGRRTFITDAAKKVSQVGGSLRDIQLMVGHTSLQTTQRYIEYDTQSQRMLINLL
jgi:integrase/recombinase XerD